MPIYDYRCNDCGKKFDVFFKVRENKEEVVCPECESHNATKLMSAASFSGVSSSIGSYEPAETGGGSCATGNCPFA